MAPLGDANLSFAMAKWPMAVVVARFELATSSLSATRSNQLSYTTLIQLSEHMTQFPDQGSLFYGNLKPCQTVV